MMWGALGVRQLAGLGLSCWHILAVFGRLVADFAARVVVFILPVLRALRTLVGVAAPFLREAGMTAAAGGLLSILISIFVFAGARKTAPRVGVQGGIR